MDKLSFLLGGVACTGKVASCLEFGEKSPHQQDPGADYPQFPMVHICKPSFLSLVLLSSPSLPFLSSLLLPCSFFSKLLFSSSPHPCPPTLPLSLTHKHTHTLSLSFACNLLTTRVRHFLGHDCGKVLKHVLN